LKESLDRQAILRNQGTGKMKTRATDVGNDEGWDLRQAFLEAMSHTAATVNIVTTDGPSGRGGVTVSAMASVSADTPEPSLLVCINQSSSAASVILENRVFCVNVLRDDQSGISDIFAGRVRTASGDKFACADWVAMTTGAPRVVEPLVAFDCRLTHSELVGTHHVIFGQTTDVFLASGGLPLIYANRSYGTPSLHSLGGGK
jgi:flavin reductase (DIM6/NTAB) family NADH-FMN oxidoreductase RutF